MRNLSIGALVAMILGLAAGAGSIIIDTSATTDSVTMATSDTSAITDSATMATPTRRARLPRWLAWFSWGDAGLWRWAWLPRGSVPLSRRNVSPTWIAPFPQERG